MYRVSNPRLSSGIARAIFQQWGMAQTALFIAGSAAGNLILNRLVSKGALKAVLVAFLVAFGGLSFARF